MEGREAAEAADGIVSILVMKKLPVLLTIVGGEDGGDRERESLSKGTYLHLGF